MNFRRAWTGFASASPFDLSHVVRAFQVRHSEDIFNLGALDHNERHCLPMCSCTFWGMDSDPFDNKRHVLRHVLEQMVLPEAAFSMHPKLLECVRKGDGPGLLHFCSKALLKCLSLRLIHGDAESDENIQLLIDLSSKMRLRSESEGGTFIQVLHMPSPEMETEAYRIAFAQRGGTKGAQVRYFLLEKAVGGKPMICERTRDGSHLNYGELEPEDLSMFSFEVDFIVSRSLPPRPAGGGHQD